MNNQIYFKKISWKNFLSYGNGGIEVSLDSNKMTMIIGANANGKSTLLDAIAFVLYGKAYRKINIPQLINSINDSDMVVEIELNYNGNEYRIKRGMKPRLFEIYKDGVLVDQDSKTKDYQKWLEVNVLRMSYKTFCQVVLLGAAGHTPFMQLTPADRRIVIEDLLDIGVFSTMMEQTKLDLSILKEKIREAQHQLDIENSKLELLQTSLNRDMNSIHQSIEPLFKNIEEWQQQIQTLKKHIEEKKQLKKQNEVEYETKEKKYARFAKQLNKIEADLSQQKREIEKFLKNILQTGVCPYCEQDIRQEHIQTKHTEKQKKIEKLQEADVELVKQKDVAKRNSEELKNLQAIIHQLHTDINISTFTVSSLNSQIDSAQSIIQQSQTSNEQSLLDKQKDIQKLQDYIQIIQDDLKVKEDEKKYLDAMVDVLKDSGIKAAIIKNYLPVINQTINDYLEKLGFSVTFELDENFSEIIRSRHRDVFSYENFSEGEKFRINIAVLMAWREISRIKSSINTNLLVMDEVFDSSLDDEGIENFLNLLTILGQSANIFVISHNVDNIVDRFDRVIKVTKINNFSRFLES